MSVDQCQGRRRGLSLPPADRTRPPSALFPTMLQCDHSRPGRVSRRGNLLPVRHQDGSKKVGAYQHLRSLLENTSLISLIRTDPTPLLRIRRQGFRNILPIFNAVSAPNDLPEHTTYDPIFAPTPMSGPLSAPSAAKLSLASMTGSDMKDCIRARRNLFAKVSWALEDIGAVVASLLGPTLWDGIFGPKPGGSASSHCWMRKPLKELASECWSSNNSRHTLRLDPCSPCNRPC